MIPTPPQEITTSLFSLIDSSGVVVGALGGALASRRDTRFHFDYVGIIGLGMISGVGGGLARDTLLQHGLPLALASPRYLYLALIGSVLALLFGSSVGPRMTQAILVIDALGLGFFAIAGALRAQAAGLGMLPCLLLGVMTAVGGGSLRDVFSGRTPRVFERGEPYAIAAAISALLFLLLLRVGVSAGWASPIGIVAGLVVRLLGVRFGWRTRAVRIDASE
ncbi:MAG: TRIC cation channel family protein [Acidobacteriaceae bacterium]|nr:TRIC cation channel family protein [Acidobacteriaceae bacterium]